MKKIIGLLLATGLTLGSFAQSKVIRGNIESRPSYHNGGGKTTTVVVVPRSGGYYRPYGYGYGYGYGYRGYMSPYGYMPYGYGFLPQAEYRPSGLDLEIDQIRSDFSHEISSVRHDKTISKSDRKQKIRDLKHERESEINSATQKYFKEAGRY